MSLHFFFLSFKNQNIQEDICMKIYQLSSHDNNELELQTLLRKKLFKLSLNHVKMKSGFFFKKTKPLDSILCIFTQTN